MQKDFDFVSGEWHFKSDATLGTIEIRSTITETVLHFSKDDNQAINDLIVGLLVVNPGENPVMLTSGQLMDHYGKGRTTIRYYFEQDKIPGAVEVLDRDQTARSSKVVPEFALQFHKPEHNQLFKTKNPGSREERKKRLQALQEAKARKAERKSAKN